MHAPTGRLLILSVAFLLFAAPAAAAEPEPTSIDVFESGTGGYFAYRIPALITSPSGALLAFCEGRKSNRSDDGDIDLLLRRSKDGGKTWLETQLVYEEGGDASIKFGNPCPVVDAETGTIILTMNRSTGVRSIERTDCDIYITTSTDDGATWSKPVDITRQIKRENWRHYAQGPGVGIQITQGEHKGRLIVPANYRESFNNRDPSYSHVMYSDDHGRSWRLGGIVGPHTNECQVVEIVEEGRPGLLINMRNHWGRAGKPEKSGRRLVARSFDGGATWSEAVVDETLIEPTCQASILRYSWRDEKEDRPGLILFVNPASKGRDHLTIRVSEDEGRSWAHSKLIDAGPAAYSSLTRLPDGRIGVIYERGDYRTLRFTSFPLEWISQ